MQETQAEAVHETYAEVLPPSAGEPEAPPSPLAEFWRHFRENKGAVMGLGVIVFMICLSAVLFLNHDRLALEPFGQAKDSCQLRPASIVRRPVRVC